MSGTVSVPAPLAAWFPWTDKKGRLNPLRCAVFGLLLLPAAWLAVRAGEHWLGARPLTEAIHSAGYWAAWMLLASLIVTPARAVLGIPNIAVVRRMIGNAALAYACLHLALYMADQAWRLPHIAAEIALRFYLTIGFVALVGLCVLGATSTDGWIRSMGKNWKRLHRIVYGIAVLAVFHFFLQTKADVSLPLSAAGLFYWLMLWRLLPAGRDRGVAALTGLAVAAAVLTLATEYVWYRFGTHINPVKVVLSETDTSFGLHPAALVLALGLITVGLVQLWKIGRAGGWDNWLFTVIVFAAGAAVDDAATFLFGLDRDDAPQAVSWITLDVIWAVLLGGLGLARWKARGRRDSWALDMLGLGCVAYQVVLAANGARSVEVAFASALAVLWAALEWQAWKVSPSAAVAMVPLGVLLGYGVSGLL